MGKILDYTSLGAAPADDDLLFLGDYSTNASNPTTKRLLISDLNKKRNVDAADANGLKLRDDNSNTGLFIKDGGTSGPVYIGVNNEAPLYNLDIQVTNADATLRIEAGTANDAIIRFDQTSTQRASIGYDDTGDLLKFNNSSTFGSNNHLVIDTSGNIGIGTSSPGALFDVSGGDIRVTHNDTSASKQGGIILDASLRNIRGITYLGGDAELNFDRHSTGDIWFMRYDDSGESANNPAMWIDNATKGVAVGAVADGSIGSAKLMVLQQGSGTETTPVLKLENYAAGGSNRTIVQLARTGASDSYAYLKLGDSNILGIGATNAAPGSNSVNFQNGKLSVGGTSFTYTFNSTSSSNIIGQFLSSDTAGSRLLIESNGEAAATASNVVAFPITVSSARQTNWMCGSLRNSTANYFGIYYNSANPGTPSNVAFHGTLASNHFYINTGGDSYIMRNCRADGYFHNSDTGVSASDPGAGNYCRGRFIQTFVSNLHMYDAATPSYVGALNFGQAGGTDATTMIPGSTLIDTASYGTKRSGAVSSVAPFAGKLLRVQLLPSATYAEAGYFAFYSDNTPITISSKPSHTNMAYKEFTNANFVEDTVFGLSYSDFTDSNSMLEFDAGDFLTFFLDPTGASAAQAANLQIVSTFEFYVTDI